MLVKWGRYLGLEPDDTTVVPKADGRSYKYVGVPEPGLAQCRPAYDLALTINMRPRSQSRAASSTASLVDLTDSRSLTSIGTCNESPATGRPRVTVVLSTGAKVIIPIEPRCTSSELHAEAIRRAKKLKIPCNFDNTVL